jgi:hypothetical protein
MQALMMGPTVADIMVAVIVLELLALALRSPTRLRSALPSLCAGLGLALALRCVLTGAAWPWLALWLMGSGLAHGVEVFRRWRR